MTLKFLFVFLISMSNGVSPLTEDEVISHCVNKEEGILMAVYVFSSSTYFIKHLECREGDKQK